MKTGKKSIFTKAFKSNYNKNYRIFSAKKANFVKHPAYYLATIFVMAFIFGLLIGKLAVPISPVSALRDLNTEENSSETKIYQEKDGVKKTEIVDLAASYKTSSTVSYASYTQSSVSIAQKDFYVPNIVNSNVAYTNSSLPNPDNGPLQYKNLIYGHRSTDFALIPYIKAGTIITVRGKNYRVSSSATYQKINSKELNINGVPTTMPTLWNYNGIVIMTCDKGNSYRWLVFAELV